MRRLIISIMLAMTPTMAFADDNKIHIELNKLEPQDTSCQAYIVVKNATENAVEDFSVDLVLFDNDGIISRRLAVNLAPMRAGSTSVKVFGVKEIACTAISRMLVNDVLRCQVGGVARDDCPGLIETASRSDVEMVN